MVVWLWFHGWLNEPHRISLLLRMHVLKYIIMISNEQVYLFRQKKPSPFLILELLLHKGINFFAWGCQRKQRHKRLKQRIQPGTTCYKLILDTNKKLKWAFLIGNLRKFQWFCYLYLLCRKLFFVENFLFAFINNFGDSYKILSLFTSKYDKMLTTVQKRECQKPNNHAIRGHNSKKIYFLDINITSTVKIPSVRAFPLIFQ